MPYGDHGLPAVSHLAQGLLWNGAGRERARPVPAAVLLAPVGGGKTHALNTISQDCDAGVVHAFFDFAQRDSADHERRTPATVEVLADLAFQLSRRWRARPAAEFTRFTLGMIAAQTRLAGFDRERAKNQMREEIDKYARNGRAEKAASALLDPLMDVAGKSDIVGPTIADTVKVVLPSLVRTVTRKPLGRAKHWHSDIPQAEGAGPIDALIRLSQLAQVDAVEVTEWLTAAFLADVRDNFPRMAAPDSRSPCTCVHPDKPKHWHNWVLLLDNLDQGAGGQFLADLLEARERHLDGNPTDHDQLLVIGTSGRWNRLWEPHWRPPWRLPPDRSDQQRSVPSCATARYSDWLDDPAAPRPRTWYFPVLLEPLSLDETARILRISRHTDACRLVYRATGGLPGAVRQVASLVTDRQPEPGARDVLAAADPGRPEGDPWRVRLEQAGLTRRPPDGLPIDLDELISAAPFATAPWLVLSTGTSVVGHPRIGRILTELRASLWVTAPDLGGGTTDHAELHPWIAGNLVLALTHRPPTAELPSYGDQFEALLADPDTAADPVRRAYCELALGRLGRVVDAFTREFDREPHEDWTRRLRLVTRAPDSLPLTRSSADVYDEQVNKYFANTQDQCSPVGNIVARLVTALWLATNPFAVPDPGQWDVVVTAYQDLRPLSRRPDVSDLHE